MIDIKRWQMNSLYALAVVAPLPSYGMFFAEGENGDGIGEVLGIALGELFIAAFIICIAVAVVALFNKNQSTADRLAVAALFMYSMPIVYFGMITCFMAGLDGDNTCFGVS